MDTTANIAALIPSYKELNDIYQKVIQQADIGFADQCQVIKFYDQYQRIGDFDKMLIDLLMQKNNITSFTLMHRLKLLIEENLNYYEQSKPILDAIDTVSVCQNIATQYDAALKDQRYKTKEYSDELININGKLEALSYKASSKENEQYLSRQLEVVKGLYEEEKKKLSSIYELQKEAWELAAQNDKNRFKDIYELSLSFLSSLDGYLPDIKKLTAIEKKETLVHTEVSPYFDMGIISAVHKECNGLQFEAMSEIDLYNILNLLPSDSSLSIMHGEKIRTCYLIYKLYESIKDASRTEWRSQMLSKLEIKESFYFAKYKEPVSDLPSRKSESFAERINDIFN